jgi:hypothetical protein
MENHRVGCCSIDRRIKPVTSMSGPVVRVRGSGSAVSAGQSYAEPLQDGFHTHRTQHAVAFLCPSIERSLLGELK